MGEFDHQREDERDRRSPRPPVPVASELTSAERVAASVGNHAFSELARDGAGILPDGRAHPDVEEAIARTRGSGAPLDDATRDRVAPSLGDPLTDVRVHTDDTADALASSVSARAFATGTDVYFAAGEYAPGSSDGQRLLAHELTHVAQQRGAPASGSLEVSQPTDALETEADRTADELSK
jgi:Domain of unknown function (DUF4157)